jgi:TonB family protein
MRRTILALAALPALIPAPALAEPVVLKPDSPWNVDFAEDKCRLTRTFGGGANRHFLAFQQFWPDKAAGLTVAGPAFGKFRSLQRTDARFFETQEPLRTRPFAGTVEQYGRGVIYSSIRLSEGEPEDTNTVDAPKVGGVAQLDAAEGDRVEFVALKQAGHEVRLETGPLGDAFKVLNQCTLDLLRDWGLDPEKDLTATSLPRWINQAALTRRIVADYPSAAYSQGEQAIMRMRVIVSEDGSVESCTILKATDTERLESPACRVMQGARFEPARDAQGRPFRSLYVTSIPYRIGG